MGTAFAMVAATLVVGNPASANHPQPGYCVATNPPNVDSPNPCGVWVDDSYVYEASGDWDLRVEHADGTIKTLSSEAGDAPSGGPGLFRRYDFVMVRAVTPGSRIVLRESEVPLVWPGGPPDYWPGVGKITVESDGCVEDESRCLRSDDGVVIRYTLALPEGASKEKPVPLAIAAHGWGRDRRDFTNGLSAGLPAHLLANGYALLAYDARGHGASGGEAQFNDPKYEGADVRAIIDKLSGDPRIAQESPGDPLVGMVGGSYGGEIQFVAAALDDRIDAIVPGDAWNNLYRALYPHGVVKSGWAALLPLALLGTLHYTGWQEMKDFTRWETGTYKQDITVRVAHGLLTGDLSPEARQWAEGIGPWNLFEGFDTPTMIIHGLQDTVLPPSEAAANFKALRAQLPGEKLKMRWYCGGHGTCKPNYFGPYRDPRNTDLIRFLDRWVKGDEDADTGPTFAYLTQDGRWQEAAHFPPKPTSLLRGSGAGTVAVGGEPGLGGAHEVLPVTNWQPPRPAHTSLKIDIPGGEGTIVGSGAVTITATGTGTGADTGSSAAIFLRLIDQRTQTVLGNQTTPVVLKTDGLPQTISLELEPVAWKLGSKDRLALEVLGSSTLFEPHRGAAVLKLDKVDVALPVVKTR